MGYLLRRVGFYVFTAWAAITINFFLPRLIPGDPVQSLIARSHGQLDTSAIQSLYVLFGLDDRAEPVRAVRRLLRPAVPRRPRPVVHVLPHARLRGAVRLAAVDARAGRHHHGHQLPDRHVHGRARRVVARVLGRHADAGDDVPVVHPVLLARPDRDHAARRPGRPVPVVRRLRPRRGAQLGHGLRVERDLPQHPARDHHPDHVDERLGPVDAQHDADGVLRGLHHRRARQGPVRTPRDGRLRGPQRVAAQRVRVRAVARPDRRRHAARGDRVLLPRRRVPAVPGRRREGLPAGAGHLPRSSRCRCWSRTCSPT